MPLKGCKVVCNEGRNSLPMSSDSESFIIAQSTFTAGAATELSEDSFES